MKDVIQTKEQKAISELAMLIRDLAGIVDEIGGISYGGQIEQIITKAHQIEESITTNNL